MLEMYKSIKAYPDKLRRIKFYNKELERICLHHQQYGILSREILLGYTRTVDRCNYFSNGQSNI